MKILINEIFFIQKFFSFEYSCRYVFTLFFTHNFSKENFTMKRLYLVVLLILGFSLPAKPAITLENVEKITNKIQQNYSLKKGDKKIIKSLANKHSDFFSESMRKKLLKIAKDRKLSSNQTGSPTQRKEIVHELYQFIANKKHIECFERSLKEANYENLETMVEDYFPILEKEILDATRKNFFRPLYAELSMAIKYGIPEIIERIINLNQLKITEGLLQKLETAQDKAYDCPWFNSGADFERCRELLEATVLKNT